MDRHRHNQKSASIDSDYYHERLRGFSQGKDVIPGQTYNLDGETEIPARSALILELE